MNSAVYQLGDNFDPPSEDPRFTGIEEDDEQETQRYYRVAKLGNSKPVMYRCEDCGYEFDELEAIVHFGNAIHSADMDACPECDSEDLEEL